MKIKYIRAEKVFGYLDMEVEFNDDLTFLTGINGSGKTTALRLIDAILTPSLKDLERFTYKYVEVFVETDLISTKVFSTSDEEVITISIEGVNRPFKFSRIDPTEFSDSPRAEERIEEHYSVLEENSLDHPVIDQLSKLDTPTFLGLERRRYSVDVRRTFYHPQYRRRPLRPPRRTAFRGTLGASLSEIQMLAQDYFAEIRWKQDQLNEELREEILLSIFRYEPFQGEFRIEEIKKPPAWRERQQLSEKRNQMEVTLRGLGIPEEKFKNLLNKFFDRLGKLVDTQKDPKSTEFFEWMVNRPLITLISNIFEIVDRYKEKADELKAPFEHYLSLVNRFFKDSSKEITYNTVGLLAVNIEGQPERSIEALSSGERQILVMISHLFFNEQKRQAGVFIVDEPELSLHLKWQEIFVESILEASPSTQFILATHAPSIVLDHEDKCITMVG